MAIPMREEPWGKRPGGIDSFRSIAYCREEKMQMEADETQRESIISNNL